jgi:hypothetical protein
LVPAPTSSKAVLRCHYCETDIEDYVAAHKGDKKVHHDHEAIHNMTTKDLTQFVMFADDAAAKKAGFA